MPQNKRNQVAGISNFLRNVGGAFGVSMLNNYLFHSSQVNTNTLVAHAQRSNPFFMRQWTGLTQTSLNAGYSKVAASQKSIGANFRRGVVTSRRLRIRKRPSGSWASSSYS